MLLPQEGFLRQIAYNSLMVSVIAIPLIRLTGV